LEFDLTGKGLGLRNQRFAAVINDGVVESLVIDPPGTFGDTSAEAILTKL
jgi:peroxiredoxin